LHSPLLRISHFDAFSPRSAGNWSLSSSNNSFISFRRFLSASLCDTLSSGEREYGVSLSAPDEIRGDAESFVPGLALMFLLSLTEVVAAPLDDCGRASGVTVPDALSVAMSIDDGLDLGFTRLSLSFSRSLRPFSLVPPPLSRRWSATGKCRDGTAAMGLVPSYMVESSDDVAATEGMDGIDIDIENALN
jgi:hypothetical protein